MTLRKRPMSDSTPHPQRHNRLVRWLLIGIGALSLLLGLIGIVVPIMPIMPTVPFLLVTAACWSRASPRWHRWLLSLPKLGPAIECWERERTVSRRARMSVTVWWVREHAWLPWAMTGLAAVLLLVIARLPTARDGAR